MSSRVSYLLIHPKGCEELAVRAAWGCAPWGRLNLLEAWESGAPLCLEAFLVEGVQLPPPHSSPSLQAGRNLRRKKDKQVYTGDSSCTDTTALESQSKDKRKKIVRWHKVKKREDD